VVKIAKVADFGLNSRKSLRKAKSLLHYFKAFRLQSGIAGSSVRLRYQIIGSVEKRRPDRLSYLRMLKQRITCNDMERVFSSNSRRKAFLREYPHQRPNCQLAHVK
jgi:hypothetical protein